MRKPLLLLSFLSVYGLSLFAQPTLLLDIDITPAACGNDASLIVTVNGSSEGYGFSLRSFCDDSVTEQTNGFFTALPACSYSLTVIDIPSGQMLEKRFSISSDAPDVQAWISNADCNPAMIIAGGTAPFEITYQVSGGSETAITSNDREVPLPLVTTGAFVIAEVTDACGEFLRVVETVTGLSITDFSDRQTDQGIFIVPQGGSAPYNFTLSSSLGEISNSDGFFPWSQIGCSPRISIAGACGGTGIINQAVDIRLSGSYGCTNFSEGYAEVILNSWSGGRPPITYTVRTSNGTFMNETGVFNDLPINSLFYIFSVEDACGLRDTDAGSSSLPWLEFTSTATGCNDETLTLSVDRLCTGRDDNPVNVTCLSCPGTPTQIQDRNNNQVFFNGQSPGDWDIELTTDCGDYTRCTDEVVLELISGCDSIFAALIDRFDCDNGAYSRREIVDASIRYSLIDENGVTLIADSQQGIFTGVSPGEYEVILTSDCINLSQRITVNEGADFTPNISFFVSYRERPNEPCHVEYDMTIAQNSGSYIITGGPTGNFYELLTDYGQDNCRDYRLSDLRAGTYTITRVGACHTYELVLPNPDFDRIDTVEILNACPGEAEVLIINTLRSHQEWITYFEGFDLEIRNNNLEDTYFFNGRRIRDQVITGLEPGEHTVYLLPTFSSTDCPADSFTFTIPDYEDMEIDITGNILCGTSDLATLRIAPTKGIGPYNVRLSDCQSGALIGSQTTPVDGTVTYSSLDAGEYCIQIEDSCGESMEEQVDVTRFDGEISLTYDCSSVLTLSTESIPATYNWEQDGTSTGENNNELVIAAPTVPTLITVSIDVGTCTALDTLNISPRPIVPEVSIITPTSDSIRECVGIPVTLSATTDGFSQLSWNNQPPSPTLTTVSEGIQVIEATNDLGCSRNDTVIIVRTPSPSPSINSIDGVCSGDTTVLTLSEPYQSYSWSEGENSSAALPITQGGTYSITVTDSNGCQGADLIEVSSWMSPNVSIVGEDTICEGLLTTLRSNLPFSSYAWSDNTQDETTEVSAGQYTLTVTDDNGCRGSSSFSVASWNNPEVAIVGPDTICEGQSAALSSDQTFPIYEWSDGTQNMSAEVSSGQYFLTVTDHNGCQGANSIVISTWANPELSIVGPDSVCNGQLAVLNSSQPFANYVWSDGTQSETTEVFAGQHSLTVTDDNGCSGSTFINIVNRDIPEVTIIGPDSVCNGQLAQLSTDQVYPTYQWSNGIEVRDVEVLSGTYTLTVIDVNGCIGIDSISIGNWFNPEVTIIGPDTICNGESAIVSASQNFTTYEWSNGAQSMITEVPAGQYALTISDGNGCRDTGFISITERVLAEVLLTGDTTICSDGMATLNISVSGIRESVSGQVATGSGAIVGSWESMMGLASLGVELAETSNLTIVGIDAGSYPCTISNQEEVLVTVNQLTSTFDVTPISCNGYTDAAILLTPRSDFAPVNVAWEDNNSSATERNMLGPGEYRVTMTDQLGCQHLDTIIITEPAEISPTLTTTEPVCFGEATGEITLFGITGGTSPFSLQVNNDIYTDPGIISNLSAGDYYLVLEDLNGCFWDSSFYLSEPDQIELDLGPDRIEQLGIPFVIDIVSNRAIISSLSWRGVEMPEEIASNRWSFTVLEAGEIGLQITDEDGCTATDLLNISVDLRVPIYPPTAFSPNGDGVNDYFTLYGDDRQVDAISNLSIFDRWGGLVFNKDSLTPGSITGGWDGKSNGEQCAAGSYTYAATIRLVNGKTIPLKGMVLLLR